MNITEAEREIIIDALDVINPDSPEQCDLARDLAERFRQFNDITRNAAKSYVEFVASRYLVPALDTHAEIARAQDAGLDVYEVFS